MGLGEEGQRRRDRGEEKGLFLKYGRLPWWLQPLRLRPKAGSRLPLLLRKLDPTSCNQEFSSPQLKFINMPCKDEESCLMQRRPSVDQ